MTYPPPSDTPDPLQPPQPPEQTYAADPYAAPSGEQPGGFAPPSYPAVTPFSGQPAGYAAPPYPAAPDPYPQNPYGPPSYPAYPPQARTNGLAIASLACSLSGLVICLSAPVGIVLGHIAKGQIRKTGEQGDGLATAGLWVGYVVTVLGALLAIVWLAVVIWAVGNAETTT